MTVGVAERHSKSGTLLDSCIEPLKGAVASAKPSPSGPKSMELIEELPALRQSILQDADA